VAYTEAQIRELIVRFTQADRQPILTDTEIDNLVARSKRQDSSRRPPTDAAWEPTWNINAAVAVGWELKAALVVTDFDVRSADQDLKRSQMHEMCLRQADRWKRRVTDSAQLEGSLRRNLPAGVFSNANDELWDVAGGYGPVCRCGNPSCCLCGSGEASPGVRWVDD
jgi:hypothetical protein